MDNSDLKILDKKDMNYSGVKAAENSSADRVDKDNKNCGN